MRALLVRTLSAIGCFICKRAIRLAGGGYIRFEAMSSLSLIPAPQKAYQEEVHWRRAGQ